MAHVADIVRWFHLIAALKSIPGRLLIYRLQIFHIRARYMPIAIIRRMSMYGQYERMQRPVNNNNNAPMKLHKRIV